MKKFESPLIRLLKDQKIKNPEKIALAKKLEQKGNSWGIGKKRWHWEEEILRFPTWKELTLDIFQNILHWILFPFAWVFRFTSNFLYEFFYPKSGFRWNEIIGPGSHTSYERHFSWGKLSFITMILFIIIYFTFLR